jgi:cell division protein FtsB
MYTVLTVLLRTVTVLYSTQNSCIRQKRKLLREVSSNTSLSSLTKASRSWFIYHEAGLADIYLNNCSAANRILRRLSRLSIFAIEGSEVSLSVNEEEEGLLFTAE